MVNWGKSVGMSTTHFQGRIKLLVAGGSEGSRFDSRLSPEEQGDEKRDYQAALALCLLKVVEQEQSVAAVMVPYSDCLTTRIIYSLKSYQFKASLSKIR